MPRTNETYWHKHTEHLRADAVRQTIANAELKLEGVSERADVNWLGLQTKPLKHGVEIQWRDYATGKGGLLVTIPDQQILLVVPALLACLQELRLSSSPLRDVA